MKKKIILTFILISLASGLFYFNFIKKDEKLNFYGNVETHTVDASFRVGGRIQSLFFEEGDFVNEGDLIAQLDDSPFKKEVELAQAAQEMEEARLKKLLSGNREVEIEQARNIVREHSATADNRKTNLRRLEKLRKTDGISQQKLDDAFSNYVAAQSRLEASKNQLTLLEDGFRKEDIAQQKSAVLLAHAAVGKVEISLNDTSLFAPQSGRIITKTMEEGAMINKGHTLYNISILNPIRIRAYIAQNKMGLVNIGDKVSISSDSAPQKLYYGHIAFISSVAEFTPKTVETGEVRNDLVYRMRIIVDKNHENTSENTYPVLHQGMPVTIQLLKNTFVAIK